jgi:exodeoxyribonuclease V alpha subunit
VSVLLDLLYQAGALSDLDRHFAASLTELAKEPGREIGAALALASSQTRAGHVCVQLAQFAGTPIVDESGLSAVADGVELRWPELRHWLDALERSCLVSAGERRTPLVLDSAHRLYLYRYWEHEKRVAEQLQSRVGLHPAELDSELLRDGVLRLFGPTEKSNAQRDAALLAMTQRLCIIGGGPGTGKTTTVARILALLTEQSLRTRGRRMVSLLLAPTGKAAARLTDSIRAAKQQLDCSQEVLDAIDEDASTIHRALGSKRGSVTQFYHRQEHPLICDLVLVDEASMVDVALMRRLLDAVPDQARLILLGDRHQLASVEAGSVLADICGSVEHPGYAPELAERVQELQGARLPRRDDARLAIVDTVVELTTSYRFGAKSGIAHFARAVNNGDTRSAAVLIAQSAEPSEASDLVFVGGEPELLLRKLEQHTIDRFSHFRSPAEPSRALEQLDEFRVLCAHRRGPLGVASINQRLEAALERAGLITRNAEWYSGRPIMITKNDHHLRLFNGDVGLILQDQDGAARAFFDAGAGKTRTLSPSRLPPHETVYAMSIHKSQGSEFGEVAIVLPNAESPLLTRELLYTAVTRARLRAVIYGDPKSIEVGISRPVARASGLGTRLHGG